MPAEFPFAVCMRTELSPDNGSFARSANAFVIETKLAPVSTMNRPGTPLTLTLAVITSRSLPVA